MTPAAGSIAEPPGAPGEEWPLAHPVFASEEARHEAVSGKVAVVTGASRGLGAAICRRLLEAGARVGACARRAPEPAMPGRGLDTCYGPAVGGRLLSAPVDVADPGALERFSESVLDHFGRIDLWVNNAGVLDPVGPLVELDPAAMRRAVETNLLGVLFGSQRFARHVRARPGGGVLINISSGAARRPYEGWIVYCATKTAVDALTEVLALEERSHGLRVHSVAPGVVDTSMQEQVRTSDPRRFPEVGRFRRLHREGRLNAPDRVADVLIELAFTSAPPQRVRLRVPDSA